MKTWTICVDSGHPAKGNRGAIAGTVREADINLAVAIQLGDLLEEAGFNVIYTRRWHKDVELQQRVDIGNSCGCNLFVSLHCNSVSSPGAHGLEIFTSPGETASDEVATRMLSDLQLVFPDTRIRSDWRDGDPDKEAHYFVLVNTSCPAVLVEMGFISNPEECAWLQDSDTQAAIALSLSTTIQAWKQAVHSNKEISYG